MQWVKPASISKEKINWAGNILISNTASEEEKNKALEILDNWRASHSYPMHVFKIRLKSHAAIVEKNALTSQRLKRVPAIINKLKRKYYGRKPTMRLSQMQDIGGCRAILSSVALAEELCQNHYLRGDLKHKRVGMKDYIKTPKQDGYRSIHLIYKYHSDKKGKKVYNGLLVEIQIRSKLQHLWATAIETVDFFTRQAIKSNEGQEAWMEFFRLVSSAFARAENCPSVPNTPSDEKELYSKIKGMEKELNVVKIMKGWTTAMKLFENVHQKEKKAKYFLLELDILNEKINLTSYPANSEKEAISDYSNAEKRTLGKKEYDVVLVGVDTTLELKKAYPNYFADTSEFLQNLQKILNKNGS